jgi:hypothetical protein
MGQSASAEHGEDEQIYTSFSRTRSSDVEAPDVDAAVELPADVAPHSKPAIADHSGTGFPMSSMIRRPLVAICALEGHSAESIRLWSLDQQGVARTYKDGVELCQWQVKEDSVLCVTALESELNSTGDTGQPPDEAPYFNTSFSRTHRTASITSDTGEPPSPVALHDSVISCCSIADGAIIHGNKSVRVALAWESGRVGLVCSDDGKQTGRGFMCSDLVVEDVVICYDASWIQQE